MYGDARQFAPDGGGELHYIVGVDADGNEITQHSNAVRPDDAPASAGCSHFGERERLFHGHRSGGCQRLAIRSKLMAL